MCCLLCVVCCVLLVVCCLLCVVCCLLFGNGWLLVVACWWLFLVCCFWFVVFVVVVVCCLLFVVVVCPLSGVCVLQMLFVLLYVYLRVCSFACLRAHYSLCVVCCSLFVV